MAERFERLLLAIDTASDVAGIALFEGGALLGETTWRTRQSHSRQLLPAIDWLLARGLVDDASARRETGYASELLMMAAGALFLSLNVAPTEEMIVLAYKMTPWHALALIALSVALMHGFVYAVAFTGSHELSPETPWWHAFVRFTLPGYVVAFLISLYALWTFERLDDTSAIEILLSVTVLAFPASLGAAAARLIL